MFSSLLFTCKQVYESFRFALASVAINKLRTGLSLLGITIGIFAIISVFTLIDSLELNIRKNIDSMGSNMVYVGQFPWVPEEGGQFEWWKYMNRPVVSYDEFEQLQNDMPQAEAVAYSYSFNRTIRQGNLSIQGSITGATQDYYMMREIEIEQGRYFTPYESARGARAAIIGSNIAAELFGEEDPIGKTIKISGSKTEVIGVLAKEGQSMFGNSSDDAVLIPYLFARTLANPRWRSPDLIVRGPADQSLDELALEVDAAMRRIRRLSPSAEANFAINLPSAIIKQLDSIFVSINLAGGIIGIFSILVGGFGVANIMFVSVRERTTQIGIQKALGARPYFILLQFLFEAVLLSVAGGVVGLGLIFLGTLIVSGITDFAVALTPGNILLGLAISSVIGAISGFFPAWSAARMEPVKAIFKT